jgi:ABC-type antimicrobial peptide transport system permease subunit
VVEGVEAVLRDLDPEIPFYSVTDMEEAVALSRAPSRFLAVLLGGFAAFAALLACLGVYGVVAYAVRQRRRDVAIRMAIGAGGGAVQGLFLRQTAGVVAVGLAAGVAGGRTLGAALEDLLHGVRAGDPVTFAAVTTLLGVTTLVAIWLPARRAAATHPMEVLREE